MTDIRLKINQGPALRCKVLPGFAGSVAATSPIVVTPGGGAYTVSLDLAALIASLASTYAIDADLTAIGNLTGTGILSRTASDTWAQRTLTAPAAGLTITNPAGIAGDPTFVLANDLAAVEGLAANGMAARTATDTWTVRTIAGTANEITITNGDGVAGNPVVSLPAAITFTGKTVTAGTFSGATLSGTTDVSGGQLKFPAAQSASANANTLDDYEEGTWTPVLTFVTPGNLNVVYSTQVGWYTKIGRLVSVSFKLVTSTFTHTTASGNLNITGVPFTAAAVAGQDAYGGGVWAGITKVNYTDVNFVIRQNTALVEGAISGSGQAGASVAFGDMPTGGSVVLAGGIQMVI